MEYNHWLRGYVMVPPTLKQGDELDRHRMAWAMRAVNSFEDLGFKVDRGCLELDPCVMGCGVMLGFRYRPLGRLLPVYGV